jgi:hypothetical protein
VLTALVVSAVDVGVVALSVLEVRLVEGLREEPGFH